MSHTTYPNIAVSSSAVEIFGGVNMQLKGAATKLVIEIQNNGGGGNALTDFRLELQSLEGGNLWIPLITGAESNDWVIPSAFLTWKSILTTSAPYTDGSSTVPTLADGEMAYIMLTIPEGNRALRLTAIAASGDTTIDVSIGKEG